MRLRFRRSVRWSEWKECTFCCTWWEYRKHRRGPRNGTFARLLCMWVGTAVQSQTCDWQNSSPSPWCARRFSSTPRSGLITTGLRKKSPILRASFLCLAGRKSNGKTAALHCRIANEGKTCRFWYRYIPVGHLLPEMKKKKKKSADSPLFLKANKLCRVRQIPQASMVSSPNCWQTLEMCKTGSENPECRTVLGCLPRERQALPMDHFYLKRGPDSEKRKYILRGQSTPINLARQMSQRL